MKIYLILFLIISNFSFAKKYLILYIPMGNGHLVMSESLKSSIMEEDKEAVIEIKDAREFSSLSSSQISHNDKKYLQWVTRNPDEYSQWFENNILNESLQNVSVPPYTDQLVYYIKEQNYDVVISTHWDISHALSSARKKSQLDNIVLSWVFTDYYVGFMPQISKDLDMTGVGHSSVRKKWKDGGTSRDKVVVLPLSMNPLLKRSKVSSILDELGISKEKNIILLATGGEGIGSYSQMIDSIQENLNRPVTVVAIYGRNEVLKNKLLQYQKTLRPEFTLKILPGLSQDKYFDLINSSQIYVTKTGGLSPSEGALLNVPMILLDIMGGQEKVNARLYDSLGIGAVTQDKFMVGHYARKIFEDKSFREKMIERQKRFVKGEDTKKFVNSILKLSRKNPPSRGLSVLENQELQLIKSLKSDYESATNFLNDGKKHVALTILQRWKHSPHFMESHFRLLAQLEYQEDDSSLKMVVTTLESAIAKFPNNASLYRDLFDYYDQYLKKNNDPEIVKEYISKIESFIEKYPHDYPQIYSKLAKILERENQDNAVGILKRGIKNSNSGKKFNPYLLHQNIAEIYEKRRSKRKNAEGHYRKAIEYLTMEKSTVEESFVIASRIYIKLKDDASALSALEKNYSMNPEDHNAVIHLGNFYYNQKLYSKAANFYILATKDPGVGKEKGMGLRLIESLLNADRMDEVSLYKQFFDLDSSDDYGIHYRLGKMYGKKNLNVEALDYFNKALSINPKDSGIYQHRGSVYEKMGATYLANIDYQFASYGDINANLLQHNLRVVDLNDGEFGVLGKGQVATVYLVTDEFQYFALKVPHISKVNSNDDVLREIAQEEMFIHQWQEFGNTMAIYNKLNFEGYPEQSVLLKKYIQGKTLHKWLQGQELFDGKNGEVLFSLKKFLENLLVNNTYVYDFNTKNLMYDDFAKIWVLVDGGRTRKLENAEQTKKLYKNSLVVSSKEQVGKWFDFFHEYEEKDREDLKIKLKALIEGLCI